MKAFLQTVTEQMQAAFEQAGYPKESGVVTLSNRPDLCELQCNGAMALAKSAHKAPFVIAQEIADELAKVSGEDAAFSKVEVVKPGFLNMDVSPAFLAKYLSQMASDERLGAKEPEKKKKIIIDYGGPNVAKPLHVGHLRSAVIGEAVKRIARFAGHEVIGDIHMGDWGLQMGLIICELKERKPELPYFDESFEGEYPKEAPFTISELEEIYPTASGKANPKQAEGESDEAFAPRKTQGDAYKAKAMECTKRLQDGQRGYRALWDHIMAVSVADMKKNYENLNVDFEYWNGESTVHDRIPGMVKRLKDEGYAHLSEGALVIDVAEESDTKQMPPCMVLKSDGASLYNTTDLATLEMRREQDQPDQVIYVVDKRQSLYFEQIFRAAKKSKIVDDDTDLFFLGFGTVNGKDGKPYKTREGGVMRLSDLIGQIRETMLKKILDNKNAGGSNGEEAGGETEGLDMKEAETIANIVALSAIKYGDLSNQAAKDYIFDIDRFTSFEGDTGPYILYTIVRIRSILAKYEKSGKEMAKDIAIAAMNSAEAKELALVLSRFGAVAVNAYEELAPHKICAYVYELANACNRFYHSTRILGETDEAKQKGYIDLLRLTERVFTVAIDLLGFTAPERM
ncbi:MAG: arginine--tRNA ligase [Lachnospiraceae bacterium]|nr:arginine--tRNA ligase [Lachnospiraceae bacterium]